VKNANYQQKQVKREDGVVACLWSHLYIIYIASVLENKKKKAVVNDSDVVERGDTSVMLAVWFVRAPYLRFEQGLVRCHRKEVYGSTDGQSRANDRNQDEETEKSYHAFFLFGDGTLHFFFNSFLGGTRNIRFLIASIGF
jgi:hypothetical protein